MKIVLFSIFGFNVYSHGVFLVLSMAIGGWLLYRLAKKQGLSIQYFLSDYLISLIVGILASRILFYLINLKYYQSFYQVVEIWQGGLVSFAGFIVGAIIFLLFLKYQKQELSPWLDLAGIVFPLAIAIGRVGCVLNGEFGIKTSSIFAIYGYMPVTAFEIFLGMAIFTLNFYLFLNYKRYLPKYFLFFSFVALYSFVRIFIDAYRIDPQLAIGMNLSQLTSLAIFIISIVTYGSYFYKRKARSQ
ncbi:hypothetical protein COX11_02910 [Candidatus Berkelbacteria bacterium CG23_combo_of_CG06-09_8_20_14_all_41_73]|uniref:Phosphatidylglycerol--prolipoprotein diacylglyceryl transferase n=3 Tax=Candidatus Berkelbacteria TaxID=1618330 RepID=A0A2H0AZ53_9BACT|nr:MAG: hypothetical protein COX11_02910 [Candidatus Berkelbacteria bacterium CG23_combo_of_CG06-09_8_20_14_all_41_73]PIR27560.1 MAG: hypothetical protein COV40_00205 [Candidatus Berkelbacteria bacterium CG11_big_fil_rev_8_21_14_0_20_42_15]PIZ27524.1 MAG: hypothetical protein COY45_02030 [Candidatus Berkelbacteria bacterium CG_4_10_14_0_8_um_filter_42_34]